MTVPAEEAGGITPTGEIREPDPTVTGMPTAGAAEADLKPTVMQDDTISEEPEPTGPAAEPTPVSPAEKENPVQEEVPGPVHEDMVSVQEWKQAVILQVQALDEQYGDICVIDRESPEGHRCGNRYSFLSISGYDEPALFCLPPTGIENAVLYVWQEGALAVYASGEDCRMYTEEPQMNSEELMEQIDP